MHNTPTDTKKRRIGLKLFLSIIGFFALLILGWFVFCISRFSCADDIPTRIELGGNVLLTKLYPNNILVRYTATRRRFGNVYYPHCFSDTNGGKYISNLGIKNAEKLIQLGENNQGSYFSKENSIKIFPILLLTSHFKNKEDLLRNQDYINNISIDQFYLYAGSQYLFKNHDGASNEEINKDLKIAENYILKALSIHKYPVYYDTLKEIHLSMENIDAAIEDSKNFINLVQSGYIIYNYPKELLDKYEEDTSTLEFKDNYLYIAGYNDFLSLEKLADLYEKSGDYTKAIETLHLAEDWANLAIGEKCSRDAGYPRHCSLDKKSSLESGKSIYIFTESDNQEYIQRIEERINTLNQNYGLLNNN